MGVLDIIDTNTVEFSKPAVRLAMKEVRHHALSPHCCVFILIYPFISPGGSHITRYQDEKALSQGTRDIEASP